MRAAPPAKTVDFPIDAAAGFADGDEFNAVGGCREFAEVEECVVVGGEVEVVARFVAEDGFGGGDLGDGADREDEEKQKMANGHFYRW